MSFINQNWYSEYVDYLVYYVYHPNNFYFRYISPEFICDAVIIFIFISAIILNSVSSLKSPKNASDPRKHIDSSDWDPSDIDDFEEPEVELDELTSKFMILMPVLMAIFLSIASYCAKYHKEYLQVSFMYINKIYSIAGIYYMSQKLLTMSFRNFAYYTGISSLKVNSRYRISLHCYKSKNEHIDKLGVYEPCKSSEKLQQPNLNDPGYVIDNANILALIIALLYARVGVSSSHLILQNIAGLSITNLVTGLFEVPSFKTLFILMIGLMIYDFYFVYMSDKMSITAEALKETLSIMAVQTPRIYTNASIIANSGYQSLSDLTIQDIIAIDKSNNNVMPLSILGLGDVLFASVFSSTCIKYDLYRFHEKKQKAFHHLRYFPKPYFSSSIIGNFCGLLITCFVHSHFGTSQPALVFIVPSLLVSVLILAIWRGELNQLWTYDTVRSCNQEILEKCENNDVTQK